LKDLKEKPISASIANSFYDDHDDIEINYRDESLLKCLENEIEPIGRVEKKTLATKEKSKKETRPELK